MRLLRAEAINLLDRRAVHGGIVTSNQLLHKTMLLEESKQDLSTTERILLFLALLLSFYWFISIVAVASGKIIESVF
jgi:hypothetical protein